MINYDNLNVLIKTFSINIISIIIFFKMANYKNIKIWNVTALVISSIISMAMYIFLKNKIDIVVSIFSMCIIQSIALNFVTKLNIANVIVGELISVSLSYLLLIFSGVIEFLIQRWLVINNTTVNVIITLSIESVILFILFKIRKIKKGIAFIQKKDSFISIILINIGSFILLIYGLLGSNYGKVVEHIFYFFTILGISLIITIQKFLSIYYKQKLLDDTITDYKNQIIQKDSEIKRLTEENFKINKINHEFNQRQNALELMVKEHIQKYNFEVGEDNNILNRVNQLTAEHSNKMQEIKSIEELPLTEIKEIDDMFAYMQKECAERNIDFKLKINGNIFYMINNLISVNSLETLIGDHIRDAIIAVESSNNKHREIFAILGKKDSNYEFCVYDTGIDFELDTFSKLGIEPATTHKDAGGTGIGFITTFETLKKCNASIEIEELKDSEYSKCVKFIFDDKNEYRIKSYRAEEIKAISKNSRIIVCS